MLPSMLLPRRWFHCLDLGKPLLDPFGDFTISSNLGGAEALEQKRKSGTRESTRE
jgi:hypothetical protein